MKKKKDDGENRKYENGRSRSHAAQACSGVRYTVIGGAGGGLSGERIEILEPKYSGGSCR